MIYSSSFLLFYFIDLYCMESHEIHKKYDYPILLSASIKIVAIFSENVALNQSF